MSLSLNTKQAVHRDEEKTEVAIKGAAPEENTGYGKREDAQSQD